MMPARMLSTNGFVTYHLRDLQRLWAGSPLQKRCRTLRTFTMVRAEKGCGCEIGRHKADEAVMCVQLVKYEIFRSPSPKLGRCSLGCELCRANWW